MTVRGRSKAPLAVGGILATPLFFVGLLAMSLAVERPSVAGGRLAAPAGATEVKIWLLALVPFLIVVLAGVAGMVARAGVVVPALAAIATTLALLQPLGGWEHRHARRFPDGMDLIPDKDVSNSFLRGEWEQTAHRAADQIGRWTIVIAVVAIAATVLLEVRRRRAAEPGPGRGPGTVGDVAGVVRRSTWRRWL